MFGHIDRGAAIFAAECEALQHAEQNDDDRRRDADARRRRNHADAGGCDAHQGDGDEESIFTPEPVAEEAERSEEHTSELQSLMRISYAVFCLKKKKQ